MSTPNPKIEGNMASAPPFLPQFKSSSESASGYAVLEYYKKVLFYDADSEGSSDDEVEKAELEMLNAIADKLKKEKQAKDSEEKDSKPSSAP